MEDALTLLELKSKWTGRIIRAYAREGTNDRSVLEACIVADEYHFADLLPAFSDQPETPRIAIDLGAHIGGAALALISAGYFVRAVEPIPDNVEMLRKNLELNGWTRRCPIHPEAVGKRNGEVRIEWGTVTFCKGAHKENNKSDRLQKHIPYPAVDLLLNNCLHAQ